MKRECGALSAIGCLLVRLFFEDEDEEGEMRAPNAKESHYHLCGSLVGSLQ